MITPPSAMVLAAGLGTRMRPLTDHTPKPLLSVAGRSLLDRTLDHLVAAGVTRAVVNVHYLADQIEAHLAGRRDLHLTISDERRQLLETGGGLVKALPLLPGNPVLVINSDSIWTGAAPLSPLLREWDGARMDVLLLLTARDSATGYTRAGDFLLDDAGRLIRRGNAETAPWVFTGAHLLNPALLAGESAVPFSLNRIWDRAIATGRAFGVVHQGGWADVGTVQGLVLAEALLRGAP